MTHISQEILVNAWGIKKPRSKSYIGIGSTKRRYFVLNEDAIRYYPDIQSHTNNKPPLGVHIINDKFLIEDPKEKGDFATFISSDTNHKLQVKFELQSEFEQFKSRINGILNARKFKTNEINTSSNSNESKNENPNSGSSIDADNSTTETSMELFNSGRSLGVWSSCKISVLNCMTQQGQAIVKYVLQNSDNENTLHCIVQDEDEKEILQEDLPDVTNHPRIKIEIADYEDVKSLTKVLNNNSTVALICPASDSPEMISITTRCIDAVSLSNCKCQVLLSSYLASLPSSNYNAIEQHLLNSSKAYCVFRLPILMESFLLFGEEIRSCNKLSLPVNPEYEFSTLCIEDVPIAIFSIFASSEPERFFTSRTYTFTSHPMISLYTILDLLNEYKEAETVYNKISMDNFKNEKIAEGLQDWWLNEEYVIIFHLINQYSKVISVESPDFFDIVHKRPKNFEKWLQENLSSFVDVDQSVESIEELRSPKPIKDENRKEKLKLFRRVSSLNHEHDFFVKSGIPSP